jgi:Domain of unknown function (DUF4126)
MSPEPLSNMVVSATEDGLTLGGLWLTLAHPAIALGISLLLLLIFAYVIWRLARFIRARLARR